MGGAFVLLAGAFLYLLFGPPSPEAVCRLTLDAIDRRDAGALLRLTHPAEIRRLRLNERNVAAMLDATLWRPGRPPVSSGRIEPETGENRPVDRRVYSIYPRGSGGPPDDPLVAVAVTDSRDHGWRLDLTWLLFTDCMLQGKGSQGRLAYVRLAREHGISGMMGYFGNYLDLAEVERRALNQAAQGR